MTAVRYCPMAPSRNSRVSFAKIKDVEDSPDLLEIQKRSYRDFLQRNILPEERQNIGLQANLNEVFPIIGSAKYF